MKRLALPLLLLSLLSIPVQVSAIEVPLWVPAVLSQDPEVGTLAYVLLRQQQLTDALNAQTGASEKLAEIVDEKVRVNAELQQLVLDEVAQNKVVIAAKDAVESAGEALQRALTDYLSRLRPGQ